VDYSLTMSWWRRKSWGAAESEAALPGITSVPWSTLRAGVGTAERLPTLLVALVLDPGYHHLGERIGSEVGPENQWAEALPYAVPFLLRVARDTDHPRGAGIAQMVLVEQIYGGPDRSEIEAGNADLRARVEAAYEQGRPFFQQLLRTGTPADKSIAIEILAGLNGRTGRLRRMLADLDADPTLDRTDPLIADALDTARHYLDDDYSWLG
jgi:hypothetical protein